MKLKCFAARPAQPVIYSQAGLQLGDWTDPTFLAGEVRLYCTSRGGDPTPTIVWRKDHVPVSAVGLDVDSASGEVRSTLVIRNISTSDQGSLISCTASNSHLVEPTSTSVKLDVIGEIETNMIISSHLSHSPAHEG